MQQRLAATPTGRQVWVDVSDRDREQCAAMLPPPWFDLWKQRERGDDFDRIANHSGLSREHVIEGLAEAYASVETMLNAIATRRARLLP